MSLVLVSMLILICQVLKLAHVLSHIVDVFVIHKICFVCFTSASYDVLFVFENEFVGFRLLAFRWNYGYRRGWFNSGEPGG